jgi:hypothetical protein
VAEVKRPKQQGLSKVPLDQPALHPPPVVISASPPQPTAIAAPLDRCGVADTGTAGAGGRLQKK